MYHALSQIFPRAVLRIGLYLLYPRVVGGLSQQVLDLLRFRATVFHGLLAQQSE
jgi:hypothetical protein